MQSYPIRIHVRRKGEGRGLSSAVLLGFEKARYGTVLCMDADLQHEPEAVPSVADPILNKYGDFAVGSRNVAGGEVAGWTLSRKVRNRPPFRLHTHRPTTPAHGLLGPLKRALVPSFLGSRNASRSRVSGSCHACISASTRLCVSLRSGAVWVVCVFCVFLSSQIISMGATVLALPLTTCTDPMSGFFCISKDILARGKARCNPMGFKIGLEIMVRCRCRK